MQKYYSFRRNIYSHISEIDLVQAEDRGWYILEDNLRVPYTMIAKDLCRIVSPETFNKNRVIDISMLQSMQSLMHLM